MTPNKLIYVVDDDPMITTLVVRRFGTENFKVEAFGSGEECLEALGRNPDLIILDYFFLSNSRELMNGMEIFDRIKEIRPQTPVIMLSGQDKGEIVLELARKGIDDYVIKDNNLVENLSRSIEDYFRGK
jgi:DNA-binding response OmpR family regulator